MFGLESKKLVLFVFIAVYLYLIFSKRHKALAVWSGGAILLLAGTLTFGNIVEFINWNVIGIFAGTLIMAELFIYSKVPVLLADILVDRSKTVGAALLWVCALASLLSAFVENVATVLIIAPIALELSRKLKVTPVPFLIGIAISSNLQGTATLIGDPPSMILAGYERMNFNDFFFFHGRPGIFFAVQSGAIFSFIVLWLFFKKYRQSIVEIPPEKVLSWVPTGMLGAMIGALAFSSKLDPEFTYLGGTICVVFGVGGLIWHFFSNDKRSVFSILKNYDWDTTFFLAGVFVLVRLLDHVGLIDDLKDLVTSVTGGNRFVNYLFIVWFSVLVSAFIDNVPYITAMIPVAQRLGAEMEGSHYLLVFGLLIGSCLGGNITPIGASANIVSTGILKREGHPISFWDFAKIGLPFTLVATAAGFVFIWLIWG